MSKLEREITLTGKDNNAIRFWLGHDHVAHLHHTASEYHAKPDNGKVNVAINLFGKSDARPELAIYSNGQTILDAKEPGKWQLDGRPITENNVLPTKTDHPIWLYKFDGGILGQAQLHIKPYHQEDLLFPGTGIDEIERQHGQICYLSFPTNKNGRFDANIKIETAVRTLELAEPYKRDYLDALCVQARRNHKAGIDWYRQEIGGLAGKLNTQNKTMSSWKKAGHL